MFLPWDLILSFVCASKLSEYVPVLQSFIEFFSWNTRLFAFYRPGDLSLQKIAALDAADIVMMMPWCQYVAHNVDTLHTMQTCSLRWWDAFAAWTYISTFCALFCLIVVGSGGFLEIMFFLYVTTLSGLCPRLWEIVHTPTKPQYMAVIIRFFTLLVVLEVKWTAVKKIAFSSLVSQCGRATLVMPGCCHNVNRLLTVQNYWWCLNARMLFALLTHHWQCCSDVLKSECTNVAKSWR